MAPPSSLPRLSQLDPDSVATEIAERVAEHVSHLTIRLTPAYTLTGPGDLRGSDLWLTVRALVDYAQTGRDAETDEPNVAAEYARDRVGEVCSSLWSCAGRPGTFDAPDLAEVGDESQHGEPATPIGVVLVSAWARIGLVEDRALTTREVAALASCSLRTVQTAIAEGALDLEHRRSVRRWLTDRGVQGL